MSKTQLRLVLLATAATCLVCAIATPAYAINSAQKWCAGTKIAAFPGGYEPGNGDFFSDAIYNGFRQAELDLGPTVTYYFSHWMPDLAALDLTKAIDDKANGVVFPAYRADATVGPLIDKAFAQGTIVTTTTGALPDVEAKYASRGMGSVGTPGYSYGVALAVEAMKRAGLKAGDSALVWGEKAMSPRSAPALPTSSRRPKSRSFIWRSLRASTKAISVRASWRSARPWPSIRGSRPSSSNTAG